MPRHATGRPLLGLLALLTLSLSGCMVQVSQQGEAFVYRNSLLSTLLLAGIGFLVFGFGIAFCLAALFTGSSRWKTQNVLALLGGVGLVSGSLLILGIGVPNSMLSHITVHPDRVVLQDSVLWFATGDRAIPFDSIAEISRQQKPVVRKRRAAENLVLYFHDGSRKLIEMGPKERAAYEKLKERFLASKTDLPRLIQERVARTAARPIGTNLPDREVAASLARDTPAALLADAVQAAPPESRRPAQPPNSNDREWPRFADHPAPPNGTRFPNSTLAGWETRMVRRYPINIPLPSDAVVVEAQFPLLPGVKLGACYARRWEPVTVVEVHDDGTVRCNWDNWPAFTYDMRREDLIVDKSVLAKLQTNQQPAASGEREWSDVSGRFKVMATYVDATADYVKLRKSDGVEISVQIGRLGPADRQWIADFANRN